MKSLLLFVRNLLFRMTHRRVGSASAVNPGAWVTSAAVGLVVAAAGFAVGMVIADNLVPPGNVTITIEDDEIGTSVVVSTDGNIGSLPDAQGWKDATATLTIPEGDLTNGTKTIYLRASAPGKPAGTKTLTFTCSGSGVTCSPTNPIISAPTGTAAFARTVSVNLSWTGNTEQNDDLSLTISGAWS